ncbi:tRNA pseudouridine synthase domain-containing protein [Ditylenchus destructor]|uniref:tRNA pseudouridine synthase domain-containing protein n=1 Tax=Ditylenchus destructor TaxID=166010 RepID=A0AAD4N7R1_9BILA|nr:tRNA pseudouridine synthase domain-containing protein [Ditylenchus destructor]
MENPAPQPNPADFEIEKEMQVNSELEGQQLKTEAEIPTLETDAMDQSATQTILAEMEEVVHENNVLNLQENGAEMPSSETEYIPERKGRMVRYAVTLAYDGSNHHGMQCQPIDSECNAIENDLYRALVAEQLIPESDDQRLIGGIWKTVEFQRASRTDARVSALGNVVTLLMAKGEDVENTGIERLNRHLPESIRIIAINRVTKSFNSWKDCDGRTYSYWTPSFVFADMDKLISPDYRISEKRLDEIQNLMTVFLGTHNFYNYTSGRASDDWSCNRHIWSFNIDEPITVRDGFRNMEMEFVRLRIYGNSFMMHQIRKIVGTTIAVARELMPLDEVYESFNPIRRDIPRAPATGLYLERLHYDWYDKKFGSTHPKLSNFGEEVEQQIRNTEKNIIIPNILRKECESMSMFNFVRTLYRVGRIGKLFIKGA